MSRAGNEADRAERCIEPPRSATFPRAESCHPGTHLPVSQPRGQMRRLFIAVALATLAACNSFDPLVDNTVTGTWTGTASGQAFVLNLAQTSQVVVGTGTMT